MPSATIDTRIDINASREAVWRVLTDFPRYPEWNPGYRIEGTLEVGAKLVVHLLKDGRKGMTFRPKLLVATPGEELRWLGKLGSRRLFGGEHFFVLTSNDDGTTQLRHGERFSGAVMALARGNSGQSATAYETFSQALKRRTEEMCQAR